MKLFKNKDAVVSILFVAVIVAIFIGTVLSSARLIAWNVIKNHDSYKSDVTLNSKVRSYIDAYESSFNENVFAREYCIDMFGLFQKVMGKRLVPTNGFTGTIVRGSDDKLYTANSVTVSKQSKNFSYEDIDRYAASLIDLKSRLDTYGTKLLYVQAPQKYHAGVELPINIDAEYSDNRIKRMLTLLDGKVDYIDFNKVVEENDLVNRNDIFFKTDHHWTAESAFLCYQSICRYLNEQFSFLIDPYFYDINNWRFNILKNSYLGSTGVRVGKYYVGKDDFTLITPKFSTDFVRNYTSTEALTYTGNYEHSLISGYDALINKDFKALTWGCYCGSDTSFVNIINKTPKNDKKILVVKDSFALPVCAFLSTACKQLDICDLRYYDPPLTDTVKREKYDLVIFIYNSEAFNDTFFSFYK